MNRRLGTGVVVVALSTLVAAQEPPRVAFLSDAIKVLQLVPAEPVSGVYANYVTADIVIGPDGSVQSVTVIEGHEAHRASASAALEQYRFAPVVIDGKPSRVMTTISVHVPDTLSSADLATGRADTSGSVQARRDTVLTGDCSRAVMRRDGSAEAIRTCRAAVAAAEELSPVGSYERRAANAFLADVYMLAGRWQDAIAQYQTTLDIVTPSDGGGYRAAEYLSMIALAHVNLGDLPAADRALASAVTTAESSMAAHPDGRELHVQLLRTLLDLHARIKRQRSDEAGAVELERRTDALGRAD